MMFRSPYRVAYENARADNERLLSLVEKLAATLAAVQRRAAGLPEREPPPRAEPVVLTPAILYACNQWGDSAARRREAERMLRDGKNEADVLAMLGAAEED